jgi:hypothetical protein
MLGHIIEEARARSCTRLSLETGSFPAFGPARRLYGSVGFVLCARSLELRGHSTLILYRMESWTVADPANHAF